MVVTHLFQVLGFVAMEPPTSLAAKPLRDEKSKVFDALKPDRRAARGARAVRGLPVDRRGAQADSDTETMIALRVEVENWRWHGVPFYLRSGKALRASRQIVTLGFHTPPVRMFRTHRHDVPAGQVQRDRHRLRRPRVDQHRVHGQDARAGDDARRVEADLQVRGLVRGGQRARGYERLILLAMLGDQSLFTRADGIERVWEISEPLLDVSAAGPAVRGRLVGAGRGGQADRPATAGT